MTNGFIRGLWGDSTITKVKTWPEITKSKDRIGLPNLTVFAWGDDNYQFLLDSGYQAVKVDPKPFQFGSETPGGFWRHKIEAMRLSKRIYNGAIWLDWDIHPVKQITKDFWNQVLLGATFQANVTGWKRKKIMWRQTDQRKELAGAAVYIGDQVAAGAICRIMEAHQDWDDELAMTYYVDMVLANWLHCNDERISVGHYAAMGHEPTWVCTRHHFLERLVPGFKRDLWFSYPQ